MAAFVAALAVAPSELLARGPSPNRFTHPLPDASDGVAVLTFKPYADDVDPSRLGDVWSEHGILDVAVAPGAREPASFVVYAPRDLGSLHVSVSALRGAGGTIASGHVELRSVTRVPTRKRFDRPGTDIVGRFMPRLVDAPLGRRRFREIWLEVDVPADATPGIYVGRVTLTGQGNSQTRVLRVRVRPMALRNDSQKQLGIFYRAVAGASPGCPQRDQVPRGPEGGRPPRAPGRRCY